MIDPVVWWLLAFSAPCALLIVGIVCFVRDRDG